MRKRFIRIIYVAIAFTSFLTAQDDEPFIEGDNFEFSLPDLKGNIVTSSDKMFDWKVIFVTLWGTWCPPCISEIPTLNELQHQFDDSLMVVLAIAFEYEENDTLRREQLSNFVNKKNIDYLVLDGGVPKNFETVLPTVKNASGLPIEIIINKNGEIEAVRNGYGYSEVWAVKIKQEVKTLLKNYATSK